MHNKRMQKKIFFALVLLLGPALYFGWKLYDVHTTCIKMSVKLSFCNTPIIDAVIEDKVYPLLFDLGSKFSMSLDNELLEKTHNKQELDLVQWKDWKGNPHEAPSYLIPKVNICGLLWSNVIVKEQNQENNSAGLIWNDNPMKYKDEHIGKIGFPLIEKTNLCLDLYHRSIYFCNSLKKLKKMRVCPNDMVQVPFWIENKHIIVQAETDIGKLNLVLDTGATVSFVKSPLKKDISPEKDQRGFSFFRTSHFAFAGKDFGKLKILVFDFDWGTKEIDGVLGMNFLENQIIYIDYPNRILYVGDCHP